MPKRPHPLQDPDVAAQAQVPGDAVEFGELGLVVLGHPQAVHQLAHSEDHAAGQIAGEADPAAPHEVLMERALALLEIGVPFDPGVDHEAGHGTTWARPGSRCP